MHERKAVRDALNRLWGRIRMYVREKEDGSVNNYHRDSIKKRAMLLRDARSFGLQAVPVVVLLPPKALPGKIAP